MAYLERAALEAMEFLYLGRNVRISDKASIYEPGKMSLGDECRIDDFCVVSGRIEMGRNVHIAPLCLIAGGAPGITFGDFSGLAYHVQVFAQSDDYSGLSMTNPTVPAKYKNEIRKPVDIGRHSIVGAGSIIVPGTALGEGTAIGAMSMVLASTEPWSIYVGIPARRIKARKRDLLAMETEYLGAEKRDDD